MAENLGSSCRMDAITYPLVCVVWDDAHELESDWVFPGKKKLRPCLIRSYGLLVEKNNKYVVLGQDLAPDGMVNGRGQIPRGMVRKITTLRKKV